MDVGSGNGKGSAQRVQRGRSGAPTFTQASHTGPSGHAPQIRQALGRADRAALPAFGSEAKSRKELMSHGMAATAPIARCRHAPIVVQG